ncbi:MULTISPECIES: hypothetical protein [unclassified Streptomyces]|uniref:hypothetical protein n=1 Tax=unclassified Streptomyces TaxID=2593676 RepID=UPI0038010B16
MSGLPPSTRLAWLLVVLLFAVVVALAAFILKTRTGTRAADAALVAGSAFAGSVFLSLGLIAAAIGV